MLQRFVFFLVLISVCGATYFPICDRLACGPYGRCLAGRCVCRPNYTLRNGRCVGGCRGGPCRGGKICKYGKCVCPSGEVEVDGTCVDRCSLCGDNGSCKRGRCICDDGYVLRNHVCVDPCIFTTCLVGRICRFGKCLCPKGEIEVDNECVDRCSLCGDNGSCKRGRCICDDGYVLRNHVCVDPCIFTTCPVGRICKFGKCLCPKGEIEVDNECVEQCPARKEFKRCSTACPINCENYDNPPDRCTRNCRPDVKCVCKEGYIELSSTDFRCVRPSKCPERCPPRKEFKRCSTACPVNCENYKNPPLKCTKNCRPDVKCVCKEGYIELSSTDFRCVKPSKCPDPCSGVDCGRNGKCRDGKCLCRNGYKEYKGKCVRICPFPKVFNPCPTACPLTCLNYLNRPGICTANCRPGVQCVCPGKLVERSDSDSTCVPTKLCPRIYY